jgi:hypothetical protein
MCVLLFRNWKLGKGWYEKKCLSFPQYTALSLLHSNYILGHQSVLYSTIIVKVGIKPLN